MNAPEHIRLRGANQGAVGVRTPLIDGVEKVTGKARYTADIQAPDALVGRILRSPVAHARIISIDTREAWALKGVHAHRSRGKGVSRLPPPPARPASGRCLRQPRRAAPDTASCSGQGGQVAGVGGHRWGLSKVIAPKRR